MVVSSAGGAPRPIYGGLCTFEEYGDGYFFPSWVASSDRSTTPLGAVAFDHFDMYHAFYFSWIVFLLISCVHLGYAEAGCNT
jgi:hypothetical protein